MQDVVTECQLCSAACVPSYFAHLLSPCPQLEMIFTDEAGLAFLALLQQGQHAFAVYTAFSVFALALAGLDLLFPD